MLPSQVCILNFATSSRVTRFLSCFKWFFIRSASCVVFGTSQVCSSYRLLVVSSRISFFDSRYLMSREHGSINRLFLAPDLSAPASCFNICDREKTWQHTTGHHDEVKQRDFS